MKCPNKLGGNVAVTNQEQLFDAGFPPHCRKCLINTSNHFLSLQKFIVGALKSVGLYKGKFYQINKI